ncbi:DUF4369 domain-containing protein [Flavobacterium antarcticum]|uniref:DUF4369 domain-containing protein n=1 Tax=Flavobacterium antarcticum TaxID=271155 RepID=UPI0003B5C5D5|nr:DUF4369 domain-containing protein [Flavobacterium antarcticum]
MKNVFLALATALVITSCSDKNSDANTHITGNIKGFSNGMLYLQKMNDSTLVAIDSVKIQGSSTFKFDFNLESPEVVYLVLDRGVTKSIDNSLPVFAEPGTMTVDTDLKYFYASAKVTGSKNHELFEQFQKINSKYNSEILDISKEKYDALRFKRVQDLDSIESKLNKRVSRKYLYGINFALTNKEYEVAPYVALTELTGANIKYLDTINNSMSQKVAQSRYGKLLTEYLNERRKEN